MRISPLPVSSVVAGYSGRHLRLVPCATELAQSSRRFRNAGDTYKPTTMTMNNFLTTSGLVLLLSTASGCGSTSPQRTTNNQSADSNITANVKAAAKNDTTLNASAMKVETSEGVVKLSGFVGSHAEVTTASNIARGIAGVTAVKNDMMVKTL